MGGRGGRALLTSERRRAERRRSTRLVLTFPERRTGFDRRGRLSWDPLRAIRDQRSAFFTILVAINALNVLDYVFTIAALSAGFREGNPVMAVLVASNPGLAALFKLGIVGVATAIMWRFRRYRSVITGSLFVLGGYIALIGYHIYGMLRFY